VDEQGGAQPEGEREIGTRAVELATALVVLAFSALLIVDSVRLGFGWAADGPEPGFYPFYVGLFMAAAALVIVGQQLVAATDPPFVKASELRRVLAMLVPSLVYVGAIYVLGLYVASALFLLAFMMWQGRYSLLKSLPVALGIPVATFLLFDVWFQVPLPKGPLEAFLGF
jgi:putative tricarboxylic transport membrane protein